MTVPQMMARTALSLSPRAQDLNQKLVATVEEFRRYYPDTSDSDVLSALRATGMSSAPRRKPALVAAAGAAVAAAMGVVMATRETGGDNSWAVFAVLLAAVAIVAVGIVRLTRHS